MTCSIMFRCKHFNHLRFRTDRWMYLFYNNVSFFVYMMSDDNWWTEKMLQFPILRVVSAGEKVDFVERWSTVWEVKSKIALHFYKYSVKTIKKIARKRCILNCDSKRNSNNIEAWYFHKIFILELYDTILNIFWLFWSYLQSYTFFTYFICFIDYYLYVKKLEN